MNSEYFLRNGEEKDFPVILEMIHELAFFEKAPHLVENTLETMIAEQSLFQLKVVEYNGQVVAMALFYFAYYTWVGKSLYLDDLYVKEAHRGKGIGSALLSSIFKVAQAEQCKRVRWQVLDWNEPAIALYKKMGAKLDAEWINCDFDKTMIHKLS
jgi:GNAT superfamily N-acetyltransferase